MRPIPTHMLNKLEHNQAKVCVVVPVFNRIESTERFIRSFSRSTYRNYSLVIVDDGSTDGTSDVISKNHPNVVVIKGNGDLWWAGGTNLGVKYAIEKKFDFVLTINNDSEIEPDTLRNLVTAAHENPNTIIGSRIMLDRQGTIWSLGVSALWKANSFLRLDYYNDSESIIQKLPNPLPTTCLTGNGTLVSVDVFKKIGLYESKFCPQYHADSEFTLRAKSKGIPSVVALDAVVYNNDFVPNHDLSVTDELFNKKSSNYWRPIVYVFLKHSPLQYKIFVYKNFKWLKKRLLNQLESALTA